MLFVTDESTMEKTTSIKESIGASAPRGPRKKKSADEGELFASTLQSVDQEPIRRTPRRENTASSTDSADRVSDKKNVRADRSSRAERRERPEKAAKVGPRTDDVRVEKSGDDQSAQPEPSGEALPSSDLNAAASEDSDDREAVHAEGSHGRLASESALASEPPAANAAIAKTAESGAVVLDLALDSSSQAAIDEIPAELEAPNAPPSTNSTTMRSIGESKKLANDAESAVPIDESATVDTSEIARDFAQESGEKAADRRDPSANNHAATHDFTRPDSAAVASQSAQKSNAVGTTSSQADFAAELRETSKSWGSPDIDALMRRAELALKPGMSRLTLAVDPPEYGKMDLRFTLKKGRITGEIVAESAEVAQRVRDDLGQWQKIFEKNGVRVDDLFVRTSTADQGGRMDGRESHRPFSSIASQAIGGIDESETAKNPHAMRNPIVQGRGRLDLFA
jgi:hypothetical protein